MSWQLCPLCKGSGETFGYGYSTSAVCQICSGNKIINEQTGRPPTQLEMIQDEKTWRPHNSHKDNQ